jgi:hypothetical protein
VLAILHVALKLRKPKTHGSTSHVSPSCKIEEYSRRTKLITITSRVQRKLNKDLINSVGSQKQIEEQKVRDLDPLVPRPALNNINLGDQIRMK